MDTAFINKLMHIRNQEYNGDILFTLLRIIEKYPYFSLLYYHSAKCSKILNVKSQQSLSLASAYSPDRARLKEFMEENIAFQYEETKLHLSDLDKINAKIHELKILYHHNENKEDEVTDIIKEIDSYKEPDISSNPTKEELVERFLQIENPKLKRINEENYEKGSVSVNEIVKKSAAQEFEIVTETMAEIYLKQGHKDKAIKIYKQLNLVNPEKSIYFADRISEIEKN